MQGNKVGWLIPRVKTPVSWIASKISRILSVQSLGDMHHLLQYAGTDARLEAVGGAHIYRTAQQALKGILQGKVTCFYVYFTWNPVL
jgi:hypothetical protein